MKSSFSCMYLVPVEIYEKLLDCIDSNDVRTIENLNRSEIGNEFGAFPDLPPPPPPSPFYVNVARRESDSMDTGPPYSIGSNQDQMEMDYNSGPIPTAGSSVANPSLSQNEVFENINQPDENISETETNRISALDNTPLKMAKAAEMLENARALKKSRYTCPICKQEFTNIRDMLSHLKQNHIFKSGAKQTVNQPTEGTSSVNVGPLIPSQPNLATSAQKNLNQALVEKLVNTSKQPERTDPVFNFTATHKTPFKGKPKRVLNMAVRKSKYTGKKALSLKRSRQNDGGRSKQLKESEDMDVPQQPEQSADVAMDTQTGRSDEVFKFTAAATPGHVKRQKKRRVKVKPSNTLFMPQVSKHAKDVEQYNSWASPDENGDDSDTDVLFIPRPTTESYEDIAKISCKLCNTEFNKRGTLLRHVKNVHNANQNYEQNDVQGVKRKNFVGKTPNVQSKKFASNLYKCSLCTYIFAKESALFRHIKNVHEADKNFRQLMPQGEKRKRGTFDCSLCSSSFNSRKSLNNHTDKSHHINVKKSVVTYESWK